MLFSGAEKIKISFVGKGFAGRAKDNCKRKEMKQEKKNLPEKPLLLTLTLGIARLAEPRTPDPTGTQRGLEARPLSTAPALRGQKVSPTTSLASK